MKCVPVHHGIPAVLHRDEPWLHRHSENGALLFFLVDWYINRQFIVLCMNRQFIDLCINMQSMKRQFVDL